MLGRGATKRGEGDISNFQRSSADAAADALRFLAADSKAPAMGLKRSHTSPGSPRSSVPATVSPNDDIELASTGRWECR